MNKNEFSLQRSITSNLIFRGLTIDDVFDIYSLYSDPQVMRFDQSDPLKDQSEAEDLIRTFKQSNRSPHSINWGVELKGVHKIIGTCGFKNWDRLSHHSEIGGNVSSKHWGKRYGTEMLQFMLDYGFKQMHLNKIYAYTNVKNSSVLTLMEKYDFTIEGRLREHQLLNNRHEDVFLFSLLKNEYNLR